MNKKQINSEVTRWAREIAAEIKAGNVDREEPHDAIFQAVDSGWVTLGFPAGLITEWPVNPSVKIITLLGRVLEYCEQEAWLEDDSGLWEGLTGSAVLASQAFFSLENVLWEKLRKMNVL